MNLLIAVVLGLISLLVEHEYGYTVAGNLIIVVMLVLYCLVWQRSQNNFITLRKFLQPDPALPDDAADNAAVKDTVTKYLEKTGSLLRICYAMQAGGVLLLLLPAGNKQHRIFIGSVMFINLMQMFQWIYHRRKLKAALQSVPAV